MDRKFMQNKQLMSERKKLRLALAENNLELAKEYLDIAKHDQKDKKYKRGVIDAAYNAVELCAKGLLSLKLDKLPSTHSGVVQKFGEIYCKSEILERELGRQFRVALVWRNKARYDKYAEVTLEQGRETLNLAETLLKILQKQFESLSEKVYNLVHEVDGK